MAASPLPEQPEIRPKRLSALIDPSRAKLFADVGANVQGMWVGVTWRSTTFTPQVIPVPLHRASLNVVMADGHAAQITRSEFEQPGGPTAVLQDDPKQKWWRDGAVPLKP